MKTTVAIIVFVILVVSLVACYTGDPAEPIWYSEPLHERDAGLDASVD